MLNRIINSQLSFSFNSWNDGATLLREREIILKRFVDKWRLRPATKSYNVWLIFVSTRKGLRRITNRAVSDKIFKMKATRFDAWKLPL